MHAVLGMDILDIYFFSSELKQPRGSVLHVSLKAMHCGIALKFEHFFGKPGSFPQHDETFPEDMQRFFVQPMPPRMSMFF